MEYKITELVNIVDGSLLGESSEDHMIHQIVYDTRKIKTSGSVLFIAIKNNNGNGHNYIEEAYRKGIRSFLVSEEVNMAQYPDAYAIKTEDTIEALQKLAGYHRRKFDIPVLAITGSNGKTIIKEWLYQCLSDKYHVCKSPLSYNSQLGVPLSLLLIEDHHEIAVIEAGISEPGEMIRHQRMILPDTGIFSNLGDAHDSGFESRQQKMEEKASLFSECERIIYNRDLEQVHYHFEKIYPGRALHWGASTDSAIKILELASGTDSTRCKLEYQNKEYTFTLPFRNQDLLQNCLNVVTYLLFDGWSEEEIEYSVGGLSAISNRLEIREGLNDSLIINDSYSLDMASVQMGLDFQNQYSNELKKILVLTDFDQQKNKEELYYSLGKIIHSNRIDHLITIGINKEYLKFFDDIETSNYPDTRSCLHQLNLESLGSACILVKGARRFGLETLVDKLSLQIHQTVLETDFNAIEHNLRTYKSLLDQDTKVMAVIKAEAYGSGSVQMARFLESRKINYLAVALIDEGIRIRQAKCKLPLMIFNVQNKNLHALWQYNLEPEVYSLDLLKQLIEHAPFEDSELSIHLKIESGMNRLGIIPDNIETLIRLLRNASNIKVKSVFSHLAASENEDHDSHTHEQVKTFLTGYEAICSALNYKPMKHILNTGGVVRFPEYQFDMVRLGLGLYGIDETSELRNKLIRSHTLKSHVLQVKRLKKGDTTGYNRAGKSEKETSIAVISIGYADGFLRKAGNGNWKVRIHDNYYPIIGNICMDVCMINIADHSNINPGDEVIIFDHENNVEKLAQVSETISYEIISRIAPRVKRIYVHK